MKINNKKEFNLYTRGQQFLARVLFIVWLLVGCPGSVLAMEKSGVVSELSSTTLDVKGWLNLLPENLEKFPDKTWKQAEEQAPKVAKALDRLGLENIADSKEAAELLSRLGQYYDIIMHAYSKAIEYQEHALEMQQRLNREAELLDEVKIDPDVALALSKLGTILSHAGRRAEAAEIKLRVLDIRRKLKDELEVSITLNSLAELLPHLGPDRYEEALQYAQEALDIRKKLVKNQDDGRVAHSLNTLGTVYEYLGERENESRKKEFLKEALKNKQTGLEMQERLYKDKGNHPGIAHALTNVGMILTKLGKAEIEAAAAQDEEDKKAGLDGCRQGLEHCQRGLAIRIALNEGDPHIAQSYNAMALAYRALGETTNALYYHGLAVRQSLKVFEKEVPQQLMQYATDLLKSIPNPEGGESAGGQGSAAVATL